MRRVQRAAARLHTLRRPAREAVKKAEEMRRHACASDGIAAERTVRRGP
jgi:hypothetical protein